MRTFILLLCTTVFGFTSKTAFSQNAKVVIKADMEVTIDQVFTIIKQQTNFRFIYHEDLFKNAPKVHLDKGVTQVNKLLKESLSSSNYKIEFTKNNTIVVTPVATVTPDILTKIQGPQKITGKIKDPSGQPLEGVNIIIKSTKQGVYTDFGGSYTITVDNTKENVLIFSYVGYKTIEVTVKNQTSIDLIMELGAVALAEVVLSTGYQTLKKERATGSFSKADMEVFENRRGTQSLISRLDGMIPGLTVIPGQKGTTANRNGNGAQSQTSILRGISSIRLDKNPLYVVDGVLVNDFSIINPDDVADITVLKDAAAAAIWGAKASNGVIVVTTKKGKKSDKINISYNSYINFEGKPDFGYGKVLNSKQYIQAAKETFNPSLNNWSYLGRSFVAPHEVILYDQSRGLISQAEADVRLNNLASIDNSSQIDDLWYRDAYNTGHSLSLSGGKNAYTFYSSLNYINTQGNRPGTESNVYRITINQDYAFNKSIKVFLNFGLNNNISKKNRQISIGENFLPYQLFKDEQGNSINMPYMLGWREDTRLDFQARSSINLDYKPLDEINYGYTKNNNLVFNLTTGLNIKLHKGLSFVGTYGYIKNNGTNKSYDDSKSLALRKELLGMTVAPTTSSTPIYYLPSTGGTYITGNNEQLNWTVRNQLVYSANFRESKDQLDFQVGQEANEQITTGNTTTILGYNKTLGTYPLLDYKTLANGIYGVVSNFRGSYNTLPYSSFPESPSRVSSYFALGSYMFNNKYGVDASWRVDHSNLFGSDNSAQNKPVWSVGGKWLLSKEAFMSKISWFGDIALRGTYGITGNSPYVGASSNYDILYSPTSNSLAGSALDIYSTANTKLAWESTKTVNVGIDFSIFHQRVSGSIDLYNKHTTNMLGRVPLNGFTGTTEGLGNIGSLINKGIEVGLRTINIQSKDFSWSTNFVFSYNKNKLESYSTSNVITAADLMNVDYQTGYSLQPLFAYDFVGLDNLGDPQIKLADGTITKDPYAVKIEDLKYMGTTQPVYNGGLTNTFRYKGISLTANMIYSMGNVMRNDVNRFYTGRMTASSSFDGNISSDFANRWQNPGDEANTNIPSYVPQSWINSGRRNTNFYTQGDINVSDASYVKLRDITLAYSFSDTVLRSLHLQSFSLNFQVGNFMIWKANKAGIDPEYNNFIQGSRTIPQSQHPVNIGLNISL